VRIFLAGGTGAIGQPLVRQLLQAGHDDDPAALSDWLPHYAALIGAKRPRQVPRWLAHLFAGPLPTHFATEVPPVSNAKARRELGWEPHHPSWRDVLAGGPPGP
jgi:nucleoside-diphosphate-sugar epimerase